MADHNDYINEVKIPDDVRIEINSNIESEINKLRGSKISKT